MAVELYQHNREAYEAALTLLEETGKAAIVHPTGTGKSFIGFRLCQDYPQATVCWLSPSEYIFRTQVENLAAADRSLTKQAADFNHSWESILPNVRFFSYAKLMLMSQQEIALIQPDYIILDEFHRCGAQMWGQGVLNLLDYYPEARVLGLSATNIRYLDNGRDMAEELFEGNIASEMTLGGAIVRGILNPPKYVLSLYSYEQELERYEKRIHLTRSLAVRDRADKYLQELRRALENAEGLEAIFKKHMTHTRGKYIVFCSSKEHADEMMDHVPQWFGAIDGHPHVYCVYSGDPTTSRAFADFKEDGSDHLKLLFCIDMLNEGIHVDDIDGVILFRPTISPTVFKQQIGRVMAAGKENDTVIIDVVNNIGNLYSIGAIEEEMAEAVELLCWNGNTKTIVNDSFTVTDEVRNCRELFEELENILSASWDLMYLGAKQYFAANGHLNIPSAYVTEEGYHLGTWLVTQRGIYNRRKVGSLTEEQVEKLNSIGMNWNYVKEQSWEAMFSLAEQYFEENGNLDIPVGYMTAEGRALGWWYRRNVGNYRRGTLSEERRIRLESIGLKQESVNARTWMKYYREAADYRERWGNLNIPADYVTDTNLNLGIWISSQRYSYQLGRLEGKKVELLNAIDMEWQRFDAKWNAGYEQLKSYVASHHTANVSVGFMTEEGFRLGAWVATQRTRRDAGKLSQDKINRLDELGMIWKPNDANWQKAFDALVAYQEIHGTQTVSKDYVSADGIKLRSWVENQRTGFRKDRLAPWKIEKLESIGFAFNPKKSELITKQKREFYYA